MFKYLTLEQAEQHVIDNAASTWWEGWTMKVFTPKRRANQDPRGAFHDGQWGYVYNVYPNAQGKYRVKKS